MGQAASACLPQSEATNESNQTAGAAKGKMVPEYSQERAAALKAVEKACRLCMKVQAELVNEETINKKDKSPVTVADFAAQALIIHELTRQFPEYPFIAEEDSATLKSQPGTKDKVVESVKQFLPEITEDQIMTAIDKGNNESVTAKRWWTLDPIDGTIGFLRRGQYAVALALMEDNEPILGILGCPSLQVDMKDPESATGCILVGLKGQGAFQRTLDDTAESPISVSQERDPAQAVFTESITHQSKLNQDICNLLGVKTEPCRIDSQCKYATIARGDSAIYLRLSLRDPNYREKIWDHAAGVAIVREAGGDVCDFSGKKLDFSKGRALVDNVGICCTNNALHFAVLGAIQRVDPLGRNK